MLFINWNGIVIHVQGPIGQGGGKKIVPFFTTYGPVFTSITALYYNTSFFLIIHS